MNTFTKTRRAFFDQAAKRWKEELTIDDAHYLQHVVSLVDTTVELGKRVLDIGCGTGVLFPFLTTWEVTALDISEEMLSCARKKNAPHVVEYVQGDAHQLPFPDSSFARVVMLSVVPHLEDANKAMREVFRILKPKGIVSIIHLNNAETITAIHANIGGAVAHDRLPDVNELKVLLLSLGFEVCHEESAKRMTLICRKP
jgi:demethylmenaquinone methyltransferase/2-methoxy-6-polyprenyl-1,4-benzoquinol methylase